MVKGRRFPGAPAGLGQVADALGLEGGPRHRARPDAELARQLLLALRRHGQARRSGGGGGAASSG